MKYLAAALAVVVLGILAAVDSRSNASASTGCSPPASSLDHERGVARRHGIDVRP